VNLLAEQEATKMLQMLQMLRSICDHLGLHKAAADKELEQMIETTHVEVLAQELGEGREEKDVPPPRFG
jgi:hypothetical protein